MKIGIINGSTRSASNTAAVIAYILPHLRSTFPTADFELIHLTESKHHPLPPVLGDIIPAVHDVPSLPDAYSHPDVRAWSATVLAWDAVLVVTPQYNWGIPGPLKNAFDHLYKEWSAKPVAAITLGGHGGTKVAQQLQTVCEGGLKMRWIGHTGIDLPPEVIRTDKRLSASNPSLAGLEERVNELVKNLLEAAGRRL